jgi:hypothetical protein
MHTSGKVLKSYHGKFIQFLVCPLEGLYVTGRQHWVIHQISGDDVLAPELGHQQLLGTQGPCGLPRRWLLGTCKSRCFQYIMPGSRQLALGSQMLTCAICRSGVRGLDLFLATGPRFGLLWLGGGKSGTVAFALGAGS